MKLKPGTFKRKPQPSSGSAAEKPKRKMPVGRRFKPGKSGNPEGARAHNPAIRALKNITLTVYREIIEVVMTGNLDMLRAIIKNPESSAVQVGVARAFLNACKRGDYTVIEKIAERIVGKIPDVLNVNDSGKFDKAMLKAALDELKSRV